MTFDLEALCKSRSLSVLVFGKREKVSTDVWLYVNQKVRIYLVGLFGSCFCCKNVVFGNWVHNNTSHNKSSLYGKTAQTEHVLIFFLATTITNHPLPNLMGHFAVGSWPRFVIMKSLNQRAKTKKQNSPQSCYFSIKTLYAK